mgnify:FL=1
MSHKIWEINGISLELDLEDADVMERLENAFETMKTDESAVPKDGKASARIRAYCAMFRNLFSNIFGSEETEKIFRKVPTNSSAYDDVYISFLEFINAQKDDIARVKSEKLSRYIPNRQQKRAAVRKNK